MCDMVVSKSERKKARRKSKNEPGPIPKNNEELLVRLKEERLEKKESLDRTTKGKMKALIALAGVFMAMLAFFESYTPSSSEFSTIVFFVGVIGPMVFAFPVVALRSEYLKAMISKTPDWLLEAVWSTYVVYCGVAFLLFAVAVLWSGLPEGLGLLSLFIVVDLLFIILISVVGFYLATRAIIRKKAREDSRSAKEDTQKMLENRSQRLAYSLSVGVIVYVLPAIALAAQPMTILSLRASVILCSFSPLFLWMLMSFLSHQEYYICVSELEKVIKRVESDGPKSFDKNVLAFSNILRYGRSKGLFIRRSKRSTSRR